MSLTVLITSQDGEVSRCAPDEPDAAWVPEAIWFESVIPGGWKGAGFNLRQRIDQDLGLRLLDEVEFIDEDGLTVYEGLIVKLPRQHGDDFLLGVECLGFAATMLFDTAVPYFYVDRDLSRWRGPGATRMSALLAATIGNHDMEVRQDVSAGAPVLATQIRGAWTSRPISEAWYDAGPGNLIGRIRANVTEGPAVSAADTHWEWKGVIYQTDASGGPSGDSGNLRTAGDLDVAATAAARFAAVWLFYDTSGGVDNTVYDVAWSNLRVIGDHGLSLSGSGALEGCYIDDMLVHALSAACPKLSVAKVANGGLVEHPDLVVPHAADNALGTVDRIVLDLNKYVLFEWGVYHRRGFFYRETDPDRLCWEARLDRGIHLGLEGDDAEHAVNGWLVRYTLSDGTARVAGPVGSGLDVESVLLTDTDPENSVNAHGHSAKYGETTVSFPLAADLYATVMGAAYMAQSALPSRAGNIELVGEIEHPTKGFRPVREVLAGDWIRLSDHPADVPRRIISARYDDDARKATVTVGNDMDRVDAILEQVGVKTKLVTG